VPVKTIYNQDLDTLLTENIAAIIFDCDGTLVDSMPLHMRAWQAAFKVLQADYHDEFLKSLCGMKETDVIISYNRTYGTQLDPEEMVRHKHEFFRDHMAEVKPIEPVVLIARMYHGKKPLAVVSGSTRDHVHSQLQVAGLFDLFTIILTADDPYKPKPAPDLFLEAASRLNVEPVNCLVFEDGEAGFEAARKAGMQVVDVNELVRQTFS
jgi:HAD superfamily hydrolase (TIGR01509 family)